MTRHDLAKLRTLLNKIELFQKDIAANRATELDYQHAHIQLETARHAILRATKYEPGYQRHEDSALPGPVLGQFSDEPVD